MIRVWAVPSLGWLPLPAIVRLIGGAVRLDKEQSRLTTLLIYLILA